jgi:CubicO group peptidase (beta-lactamase class C family)
VAALDLPAGWGARTWAAGTVEAQGNTEVAGATDARFALASVTKLLTSLAVLVAVEEGAVGLDDDAGPPGATVRHLLAHAAGYGFDGDDVVSPPGRRRIYSNTGYDVLARHLETVSDVPFAEYLREAVLLPLDLGATSLDGSPAAGATASIGDVLRLGQEYLEPTIVHPSTVAEATAVQFPGLQGVVPGIGRMDPCDWGLGPELKDGKRPHWTPPSASPATFGHFGAAGTFLWVDPEAGVACAALTNRDFGPWALDAWPPFGDAVLAGWRRR